MLTKVKSVGGSCTGTDVRTVCGDTVVIPGRDSDRPLEEGGRGGRGARGTELTCRALGAGVGGVMLYIGSSSVSS